MQVYAILEYEMLQICVEAYWGLRGRIAWPDGSNAPAKFEVSDPSELTVYLFARNSDGVKVPEVASLGLVKLNPFLDASTSDSDWIKVQNGTGSINMKVSYLEKQVPALDDWLEWNVQGSDSDSYLTRAIRRDTGRNYVMKTIHMADPVPGSDIGQQLRSNIEHPFIAPFRFVSKSPDKLSLFTPLTSSGHLFYYLQRERRFDTEEAIYYAAELLLVVEYLHGVDHLVLLKMEHILLDPFGHVNLCNPGLFSLATSQKDHLMTGNVEYLAPEILQGGQATRMADWWALGIFLYEVLVGIPPFYHENADEQQSRVIGHVPQIPEELPSAARDIITRLLEKSPASRLGINGASEVKAHAFFRGVDWQGIHRRDPNTPIKPYSITTFIESEPSRVLGITDSKAQGRLGGFVFNGIDLSEILALQKLDLVEERRKMNTAGKASLEPRDDRWMLVWDLTTKEFHFENRFTNEKRLAIAGPETITITPQHAISTTMVDKRPAIRDASIPTISEHPSQYQKQTALAIALESGYNKQIVLQILRHGVDLNYMALKYDYWFYHGRTPSLSTEEKIPVTPLEWAVEHDHVDLVNLFLDNGADANLTSDELQGPALVKAVRRSNPTLVRILAQRTNRVSATRALCRAVELQDKPIVNALLENTFCCDFEESDLPPFPYPQPGNDGCTFGGLPQLSAHDFTPALVRATRLGDAGLVQLLLAHGADPNVGYHFLCGLDPELGGDQETVVSADFACGRVVQLAMEKQHTEIVQLLLNNGADVTLPQPACHPPDHICPMVPRSTYLRVTSNLAAACTSPATSGKV